MLYLLSLLILLFGCQKKETKKMNEEESFTSQRHYMVESQIKSRGVLDENVLLAMKKVPCHEFVPENLQSEAYIDDPLPIGESQTISQPYIISMVKTESTISANTAAWYPDPVPISSTFSVFFRSSCSVIYATINGCDMV